MASTRKRFWSERKLKLNRREMKNFCDRDSPSPSVLILSDVATGFAARLAVICAVPAETNIVGTHAKGAISIALAVGFVLVALHADKLVRH